MSVVDEKQFTFASVALLLRLKLCINVDLAVLLSLCVTADLICASLVGAADGWTLSATVCWQKSAAASRCAAAA